MYKNIFKRLFDILISLILIILLFPVFFILIILLFIINSGKPFFIQTRPGYKAKKIKVLKFKSMNDKKDENGILLPDKYRLTIVGKLIRKTSLDELPQLVNVLIGDMSLIGPRPLLFRYIPLYSKHQMRRHEVKPGITGWAQVNGRNSISWSKKFELDIYYIDNLSFLLDIKILWLTFLKVIKSEGINQTKDKSMEPFNGKN